MDKLIITAAVAGSFTMRKNSPYVPYTPREIADEAIRAWEAGAAMVHLHMRNDDGTPSPDANRFKETIGYIREKSDVIINTTTAGGPFTPEERLSVVRVCKPEFASLDVGAVTLGRYNKEQRKWETDRVSGLNFSQMHNFADVMRELGVRPEIEAFDISAIHATNLLTEAGAFKPSHQFGLVLGFVGQAIPPSVKNLLFMVETLPPGSTWTCIAVGKHQFTLGAVAVALGGQVRVGFEDNVYLSRGVLAKSNGELVEKMVRIGRDLGRDAASPAEAREYWGLKPLA